jgi:hypothetical protein
MDIQIIYTSVPVREFSDEELDQLLAASASFNASKNITGMLLYGGGKFMQVLEGEADDVDALLNKVIADSRHSQVNVLVRTPIRQRDFGTWSMGFRRVDRDCVGDLKHFAAFFEEDYEQNGICDHPNLALAVLKSFAFPRDE